MVINSELVQVPAAGEEPPRGAVAAQRPWRADSTYEGAQGDAAQTACGRRLAVKKETEQQDRVCPAIHRAKSSQQTQTVGPL